MNRGPRASRANKVSRANRVRKVSRVRANEANKGSKANEASIKAITAKLKSFAGREKDNIYGKAASIAAEKIADPDHVVTSAGTYIKMSK